VTRAPGRRRGKAAQGAPPAASAAATNKPRRAPRSAPPGPIAAPQVECAPALDSDVLRDALAAAIAQRAGQAPLGAKIGVLDCFAGDGAMLRALMQRMPGAGGIGFAADPAAHDAGRRAGHAARTRMRLYQGDWRSLLPERQLAEGWRIVAFLAPPRGGTEDALDLAATRPPILEAMDAIESAYPGRPILYAVLLEEKVLAQPLTALVARLEAPQVAMAEVVGPGGRHGVLLGARAWSVS
jgi:hypothetical protein